MLCKRLYRFIWWAENNGEDQWYLETESDGETRTKEPRPEAKYESNQGP